MNEFGEPCNIGILYPLANKILDEMVKLAKDCIIGDNITVRINCHLGLVTAEAFHRSGYDFRVEVSINGDEIKWEGSVGSDAHCESTRPLGHPNSLKGIKHIIELARTYFCL